LGAGVVFEAAGVPRPVGVEDLQGGAGVERFVDGAEAGAAAVRPEVQGRHLGVGEGVVPGVAKGVEAAGVVVIEVIVPAFTVGGGEQCRAAAPGAVEDGPVVVFSVDGSMTADARRDMFVGVSGKR
jgi:hypothetical protein